MMKREFMKQTEFMVMIQIKYGEALWNFGIKSKLTFNLDYARLYGALA
jgi:hypothetical protein